jgi:(p)ppGpp synthase/HD superfamily hydrolase
MKNNLLKIALRIAKKAHKGQFRRDGKTPYITHPVEVAKKFEYLTYGKYSQYYSELLQAIALLHDVLENSKMTAGELYLKLYNERIVNTVICLTKKDDENYKDYILRVSRVEFARLVKIADIKHNLSTLELKNKTMRDKYRLALYILERK